MTLKPGLYLVSNLGGEIRQPSKSGGFYPVPHGAVKIGRSKNDVDQHYKEYDRYCGEGKYRFEVIFRHANYALVSKLERAIHKKLRKHQIQRTGGPNRISRIEWMTNISRKEALRAFRAMLNASNGNDN